MNERTVLPGACICVVFACMRVWCACASMKLYGVLNEDGSFLPNYVSTNPVSVRVQSGFFYYS